MAIMVIYTNIDNVEVHTFEVDEVRGNDNYVTVASIYGTKLFEIEVVDEVLHACSTIYRHVTRKDSMDWRLLHFEMMFWRRLNMKV